ncbi:MAG: 1-acyl-sn-glycerol-3-phosphate acyltransferase [Vicinamibacteria bacterium]|nr:1-acyl-sn-glycerol-3-phosphate acyltransferase [Vicinamibacteria bacterium]
MRSFFAAVLLVVQTMLWGTYAPLALLASLGRKRPVLWGGQRWGRGVLWACGVRVTVEGREHAPSGPAVYVANHVGALDIPLVVGFVPVYFNIIFKRSLMRIPFIGWYLATGGHIPVERENPFKAGRILEQAALRLKQGMSVLLFPEGTRNRGAGVRPFKRGAFSLALENGVPIIPVAIQGVRAVMSRGPWRLRGGDVRVRIFPALTSDGAAADAVNLAAAAREIILKDTQGDQDAAASA